MRLITFRGFARLIFLGAAALCSAAVPAPESLDQFIASAKHQAETGSPEFKQLVAQLDPLRAKQQALLATRRAKEAELARLQSAGSDTKRIATLQQEIDTCRKQLNVVDTQFQVLMYRIQAGPKPSPAGLGSASGRPMAVTGPTPGMLTRTVPPDKIKSAADALARSPAPSAAAGRIAATQILSAHQPGFTNVEVEQLARLILDLASQTNEAALQAELTAAKQANEKKSGAHAPDPASKEIKFEIRVPPSAPPPSRLQELQARQAKLEQATIELMKKSPAGPALTPPIKK